MLKKIILGIIVNATALYGVALILPGKIAYTGGIWFFVIGGAVMGILNTLVKPVLRILTLPIHLLTAGLSLALLNAAMFWLLSQTIEALAIPGISIAISGFKSYAVLGFIFGIINWVEHLITKPLTH